MIRRRQRGDHGASMILVLIIVTVFGVSLAALLSFSDTSIRTTIHLREQAADIYHADGALQAAINKLRNGQFNNDPSSDQNCFGQDGEHDDRAELILQGFYPGVNGGPDSSAAVTCEPDPESGAAGGLVPINDDNKPGDAILTLGTDPGEDGINVKALNNSLPFKVHGRVVSNSNIRVTNGSLESNTTITAHTGCEGSISDPKDCSAPQKPDPEYQFEPAYATPSNALPPHRKVPANTTANCPGKVMTFQPGHYDDAAALSELMSGDVRACRGSIWWFTPGTYYFDFRNSDNPALTPGANVWRIRDGQLLAGTPVNASGDPLEKPVAPASVPGSCQNPINSVEAKGVQFIFGGDSQLSITGGDVEICGSYSATRPPIAVYGLRSGSATTNEWTGATALKMTGANPGGDFANPGNIAEIDGNHATWTKTNNSNQTGTATVNGYAPHDAIPPGSVLESARLRVVHGNSAGSRQDVKSVQITPNGGTAFTVPVPSYGDTAMHEESIDVSTADLNKTFAKAVYDGTFTGASMKYSASVRHPGIERVDGIQLELSFTPPAFRGQTEESVPGNCLAQTYTADTGCAVLSTSTNYSGKLYIQGTTYAPISVVDVNLNNATEQVMRFGVIARALWAKETGSLTYDGPVIEVPDNTPGFAPGGTVVYLRAYICPAQPTCSASSGKLGLRSKVMINDPAGLPQPGKRQVQVLSWSSSG